MVWDDRFASRLYITNLVGFDAASLSEVIYSCMDTTRTIVMIQELRMRQVPITKEFVDIFLIIDEIVQALNFFQIHFKVEAVQVTTNSYSGFTSA